MAMYSLAGAWVLAVEAGIGECRRSRYGMPLAVMLQEASKTHEAKISRLPPFPRQVATHGREKRQQALLTASSRVWQRERAVLGRQEAPENCSRVLALQRERQSLQQPFCLSRSSISIERLLIEFVAGAVQH